VTRPVCPYCKKMHGRKVLSRTVQILDIGEAVPAYLGNAQLVSENVWPSVDSDPGREYIALEDMPDCRFGGIGTSLRAGTQVILGEGCENGYVGRKGRRVIRETWDRESYVGRYGAFCSLRCGLAFGQAALAAGFEIVDEDEAAA